MNPTKAQKEKWQRISDMGCCVCGYPYVEIHHVGTGAGGRKNHDKVIGLCAEHHRGKTGLHGMGRKAFARLHGSEFELLERVESWLTTSNNM